MGDPDVDLLARTFGLAKVFRRPLLFPRRLGFITLVLLSVIGFTLLARFGVPWARVTAGLGMLATCVLIGVLVSLARRKWSDPGKSLFLTLRRWDEERARRAVRALSTYRRLEEGARMPAAVAAPVDGESPGLARLHFSRVLDEVPLEEVERLGTALRRRRLVVILPLLLAGLGFVWIRPLLLFEGIDVLFAQKGVGPFALSYVADFQLTAELPAYLDGAGKQHALRSELMAVPQGSEIEVKVVPRVLGRKFVLTDGMHEVPLVSDGQGGLVARWTANHPAILRVATRLGEVLLYDGNASLLSPIEDQAPRVRLAGAPARRELSDVEELSLDYVAMDDHGITQVDLVIQTGQRVIREELARLDGQKTLYQGAHRLPSDHEVLTRAFLPVRVTVEARDGNSATGPNWGKSEALVFLPKPLGQDVAERHRNLRKFRSSLTKYLADDLRAARLSRIEAQEARELAQSELRAAYEKLEASLEKSSQVPRNTLVFLRAQLEALTRKGAERSSSEAVVLAADTLIEDIGNREAKELAENLGSAVEEIAVQAREIRYNPEGIYVTGLSDLVLGVTLGAKQLREVGLLGLDLGSVAEGDLARIRRSVESKEYSRAEAAALHLAERLKRATPSFGSKGGAVESGTPSSGSSSGSGGGDAPPSDAPAAFQELSKEVDQLAQQNAEELGELERMLRDARQAAEADFQTSDELRRATEDLSRALRTLPNNADGPAGARSEAASARGYGEAMVEALQAQDLSEAIERGMDAKEALERARKMMEQLSWMDPSSLNEASQALDSALKEAERAAQALEKRQGNEVGNSLAERAARQREFSRRAKELAERGRKPQAPLPGESIEALKRAARLMEEAATAMEAGRGKQGVERATEAQSELERALPEPQEAGESSPGAEEGEGSTSRDGSVPDEEKDRARDFRERVEKGLGRGAGRLSPAVRRYAEELK